ncbi:MAG: chorismate mutase [Cyanobacteria bacterium J083]|nr:MAG: chorismate mutase [Cyanobacteria bacterium J083]
MNQIYCKLWQCTVLANTIFFSHLLTHQTIAEMSVAAHIQAVVNHLVGKMDTSRQAIANPQRANVQMTTCRVNVKDKDKQNSLTQYLYQEQAIVGKLNQPYRQRFLAITPGKNPSEIISFSYKPNNPAQWINFCQVPLPQRNLTTDLLGESVCRVILKPLINVYIGVTPPEGCPTTARGAVKITNRILLHAQGMDTWDRGFDKEGKLVFGAKDEAYQFRWLKDKGVGSWGR